MFKKFKKKKFSYNLIYILILIFLFLVFFQKTNLFKNIYSIIFKPHHIRLIKAYENIFFSGFCRKQSHGYIIHIKNKYKYLFHNARIPKIKNFEIGNNRIPYWIFLKTNPDIENKYLILLNTNIESNDYDITNYEIIDNYQNRCLFLRKND